MTERNTRDPPQMLVDLSDGLPRAVITARPNPDPAGNPLAFGVEVAVYNTADAALVLDMLRAVEPQLLAAALTQARAEGARKAAAEGAAAKVKRALWLPGKGR